MLEEVCIAKLIQLPTKNQPPLGVDKSKYCRYHRVAGHNTEECITLKEKIEKLIQKRHIQIFVKDKDPQHDQDREQERSQKHSQTQETIEAQ